MKVSWGQVRGFAEEEVKKRRGVDEIANQQNSLPLLISYTYLLKANYEQNHSFNRCAGRG